MNNLVFESKDPKGKWLTWVYEVDNPRGQLKFKIPGNTKVVKSVYANGMVCSPKTHYYICGDYIYFPNFIIPKVTKPSLLGKFFGCRTKIDMIDITINVSLK
jgi:hypothetical protein